MTILISLLFGAVWGALRGLLDGLCRVKGILVKDQLTGFLRNLVAGAAAWFVAALLFGGVAYSLLSLLPALVLSVFVGNFVVARVRR